MYYAKLFSYINDDDTVYIYDRTANLRWRMPQTSWLRWLGFA